MFDETLTELELDDIAIALDQINPLLDGASYDPVTTKIMASYISFYHGYQFLDIADHSTHPVRRNVAVYSHGDPHILNYTNESIYALNKHIGILIDENTVYDYVRFFFRHSAGQHGRFLIIENVDDIAWKENPPPNARQAISKMIQPVTLKEQKKTGFVMNAYMVFKNGLFKADITIQLDGTISMSNEELLIEDMPILDDVIGH
jgi:hypothetical protein